MTATKRAFVKYTKSGKLIPGSLIVTTKGGWPKDGIYREVSVNLCCADTDIISPTTTTTTTVGP
jgi:hypothetical protein